MNTNLNNKQTPVLPNDPSVERAVLATILRDNRALDDVEGLSPNHFYGAVHRKCFEAILKIVEADGVADVNTVRQFFLNDTRLEVFENMVGMPVVDYLAAMPGHAVSRDTLKTYAKTVRNLHVRRAMVGIAEDLLSAANDAPVKDEPVVHIEVAEAALYTLKETGVTERPTLTVHEAVQEAMEMVSKASEMGTGLAGLSTGIAALDGVLGGLAPGGLYIAAGRPAMGKTTLAVNVAYNIAAGGVPVGVFSLEMSGTELGVRILSERSKVPAWALRKGDVRSETQWRALHAATKEQKDVSFHIDQTGGLSIAKLGMKARRMRSKHGIKLLLVDYLQLMQGSNKKNGTRVTEVTEITTGLKALAKELDIPVIAVSQLSRGVEHREDKRPILADLRESGSIEQDADVVMFVYRPAYYLQNKEPPPEQMGAHQQWLEEMTRVKNDAEIIVAKNRHGPTGKADLRFNPDLLTFTDKD